MKDLDLNTLNKKFYTISEVADMLNVTKSLLRFWETEFKTILSPKRTSGGTRLYTVENIAMVKTIYNLVKVKGMTIQGALNQLDTSKNTEISKAQILEKLLNVKAELEKMKKELTEKVSEQMTDQMKKELTEELNRCS